MCLYRVWVTNYVDADGLKEGYLAVEHPYVPGYTAYLEAKHFRAIKDLSTEDIAFYKANK